MNLSASPAPSLLSTEDAPVGSVSGAASSPNAGVGELVGPGNSFSHRRTSEIELIKAAYTAAAAHTKPAVHPAIMALAFAAAGAPIAESTSCNAVSRVTELYIRNLLSDLPESEVVRPPTST
eukprot:Gregarina_sp_Poly_1__5260@NODE_278_length_10191_cov_434_260174_g242_i0_p10_GENE_NODE_278_length_10191_cov_434_260174_g242_i0NODE_278_length_10191_cov_434_260174_g242_i0_p10_ORF_typecomplete_len122_score12_50_NODE_278_length_10191_cov_434_260174_g242_i059986363